MTIRNVFLSSTAKDLDEYRQAVYRAIEGMDGYHCKRMEDFGARAWGADEFCRREVSKCELFVGIVGHLHGSCPSGSGQSYTEREYDVAVDCKKPCLMFIASESFALPASLREPEEKWLRQRAFRERISEACIRDDFNSPDNLAMRVLKAIRNWEQTYSYLMPLATKEKEEAGGRLIPNTCDRTVQEGKFRKSFTSNIKERPETQQIYLLPGEERECHDSLVERLMFTVIEKYAARKLGEQNAAVISWKLEWPHEDDLILREQQLKYQLFDKVDPFYSNDKEDYSAPAFCSLLSSSSLSPFVIIQHNIHERTWSQKTRTLIRRYLSFWDEVKTTASTPHFVLFLNVIYPSIRGGSGQALWLKAKRLCQKLKRKIIGYQLRRVIRLPQDGLQPVPGDVGCSRIILQELQCVKRDEVMSWFRDYNIGDDYGTREEWCNQIFRVGDNELSNCKNMADIERALRKIHQQVRGKQLYERSN